jgi:hypothetical protein
MGTDINQLRQWRICHGVGRAAAAQRPHGGIVGARGGHWVTYGVGGAAVERSWR